MPSRTLVLLRAALVMILPLPLLAALVDTGKPYLEPEIATAADFSKTYYIDPDSPSNGEGSLAAPFNTWPTLHSDAAYLLKAGTVLGESLIDPPSDIYIGRYGEGLNPVLRGSGQMVRIGGSVSEITIDGVDIEKYGSGSYDRIIWFATESSYLTFANLRIVGLPGTGGAYPHTTLESKSQHLRVQLKRRGKRPSGAFKNVQRF